MQVKITTRHGHVSEETQQHIQKKAEKLLHYFQRVMMIEVLVDLKEDDKSVELLLSAEHKHDFVAHDQSENLMASVDEAVHKVEQQLRKYKEKVQERHRNNEPRRREQVKPEMEAE